MGKVNSFISSQDAFDAWSDYGESSEHLQKIKAAMKESLSAVSSGCFCHACGVWIPKGILTTQALISYGKQNKLVPLHATPCIPLIAITFEFPIDADVVLRNDLPVHAWLTEKLDDFDIRTLVEAQAALKRIGPLLDAHCADRWENAVITVDGEERDVIMR